MLKKVLWVIATPLLLLGYDLNNNGEDCGPTYEATDRGIIALHKYSDERLIVGGAFDKIYKGTANEETIHRLAEANLSNGGCTLLNSFNFTFNTDENDNEGWVKALGTYRHYLFVGGDFDIINGQARRGLAIVDLSTNQLLDWNPDIGVQFDGATDSDGISVHTLKVDMVNRILHIGGDFSTPYRGYIQYDISSLDNNNSSGISLVSNKSGLDGDVWQINRDVSTEKLYMVGSFTNKFAEIIKDDVTSYNIGFTGTPYAIAIKAGEKLFIGGDSNEFKSLTLPNFTIDNSWVPSIGGTPRYERWGNVTFRMGYVDDEHIILGVNGLTSINGVAITQIGSVNATTGVTSSWRQNKIFSGDYFHAFLVSNDWLYLSASIVRFTRFGRVHPLYPYPKVSINDVAQPECTAPQLTNDFNFTITLSTPAPTEGSTVAYSLSDGTATILDNDYNIKRGTLFFKSGEQSKILTVQVNCDSHIESNETFTVTLKNPLSATILDGEGRGTINNDDNPVTTNPILPNPNPIQNSVQIGNLVWIENDNDGDATTGKVTPVIGATVIATDSSGKTYRAVTDANGYYLITVPSNDTYIVTIKTPSGHVPTGDTIDNTVTDTTSEDNHSHDGKGTSVLMGTVDNLTVDFGFRKTAVLPALETVCQIMTLNDDLTNANETSATTTIDVLQNDVGTKVGESIRFLSNNEGKTLWEQQATNITAVTTLNSLTVAGEGIWSVQNNKILFTALSSFDGQIPSPIYYIVEGTGCTTATKYTNVGKVTINTACNCSTYESNSVSVFNIVGLLILAILTSGVTLFFFKEETI